MSRYIATRAVAVIPTLVGLSLAVFLILHLTPGDPAFILGGPEATADDIAAIRHTLRLDRPLAEQYMSFVLRAAVGDLGESFRVKRPVAEEIAAKFPFTIELAVAAITLAIIIGVTAGTISAVRRYTILDNVITVAAMAGVSIPSFWLGLLLLLGLSLSLGMFPASGRGGPLWTLDGIRHIALPAFTLGVAAAAAIARLTRSSMLEVLNHDYITTARSKGLRNASIIGRHAFKNAVIPVVTLVSIQFGHLLGGAIIVESVFGWPGVGRLVVTAISTRDYPVVQGTVLVMGAVFVTINLLVDLLYGYLDPRIRYS